MVREDTRVVDFGLWKIVVHSELGLVIAIERFRGRILRKRACLSFAGMNIGTRVAKTV